MSLRGAVRLARREVRDGRFRRVMALMTAFAAIVSGFEAFVQHRRGAFADPLMWTPVALMPPTACGAVMVVVSGRGTRVLLPLLSAASVVDGIIGFRAHLQGIARRPGSFGLGQYNVVMGPPAFAPLLLSSVGVMGLFAVALEPAQPARDGRAVAPVVRGAGHGQYQRGLALSATSLAVLAGGEAYFEHLRGSFNDRLMWTPIWLTPPMIAAGVAALASEKAARAVLPAASLVMVADGLAGFMLHLRGVRDMPGGFGNLGANLAMGPPLFAPLLFASVGVLGLLAALTRRGGGS